MDKFIVNQRLQALGWMLTILYFSFENPNHTAFILSVCAWLGAWLNVFESRRLVSED